MDKIRIVHIVGGLHSGGVEAVIYNHFRNMNLQRFEIHILSYSPSVRESEQQFRDLGCTIHVVPQKKRHPIKSTILTYKLFRKYRFDVAHAHMTLISFVPLFFAWLAGVKVRIAHSHLIGIPAHPLKKLFYGLFKLLTRYAATDYFACSQDAGSYLFGRSAEKSGKIRVLSNAIAIEDFRFNEETRYRVRERLQLEGKFCIGHIGRFTEQKNHDFLIDVFYEIQALASNACLLLVGSGELEGEIRQKVVKLGLQDKVIFFGVTTQVHELYQAMDVFVFPSLYEGLGIVVVEAQASALLTFVSEAVPKEACITDYCRYITLGTSPKAWADEVLKGRSYQRRDATDEIAAGGYDIHSSAKGLEEFYIRRVYG